MRVLTFAPSLERVSEELRAVAPAAEIVSLTKEGTFHIGGEALTVDDAAPEVGWASTDLLVDGPIAPFMIAMLKSPRAKWLQSSAAGFDHPVFKKLSDNGVVLTNSDAAAVAISEFVMARVLEAFHPSDERRRAQQAKQWRRFRFREIAGTTWLVIGLGGIGRAVATRARAFGARVIGVRRRRTGGEPADEVIELAEIPSVLPRVDVVVVCVPLNAETTGLVDESFLGAMARNGILVNVARGAIVDETALVRALDEERIGLAILDVFAEEPLPPASPLWTHPRVRLTAHCAPASSGTTRRADALFIDNLRRYLRGEPLLRVVEPEMLGN